MKIRRLLTAACVLSVMGATTPALAGVYPPPDFDIESVLRLGKAQEVDNGDSTSAASTAKAANELKKQATPDIPAVPAHVMRQTTVGTVQAGQANAPSQVIVQSGVNQILPIAIGHPNRLVTPFAHPEIVTSTLAASGPDGQCGELCVKDHVVYVATDMQHPVTMFITEAGSQEQAISLTLMPRRIPPREIFLRFADENQSSVRRRAQLWEQSQPYVQTIKDAFRSIALGQVPRGYSLGAVNPAEQKIPFCAQENLAVSFGQMLDGHHLRVFVAAVQNISAEHVEVLETACTGKDIVAVAAYPRTHLHPADKTELYVAVRATQDVPPARQRESLLGAR